MRLTSNVCQRAVEISRLIASTGGKNTGPVFLRKLEVLEVQVKGRRVHTVAAGGGCLCTSGLTSGSQVSERGSY